MKILIRIVYVVKYLFYMEVIVFYNNILISSQVLIVNELASFF